MRSGTLFLLVLTLHISVFAAEVTIGTETTTFNSPLTASSHDARIQTVYLSSEIGGTKHLTSLALDVAALPGQTLNNFTIRLKHIDGYNLYYPRWESSDWTIVYQSDQSFSSTGWNAFFFSNPFSYNGIQDLMVDISFNNTSSSSDGLCRITQRRYRSCFYATDSIYGDPLIWSGYTPQPFLHSYFPNIRLGYLEVTIPDIVGMTLSEGEAAILAAGLAVGSIIEGFSNTTPEGNITAQSPIGGQSAPYGSPVNLTRSLGPRYSGSGTKEDPYQIEAKGHILGLSITPSDYNSYFILTADIDMEGQAFPSAIIAPDTNPNRDYYQGTAFTGTFDGNGHKISNFSIQGGTNGYLGLFGAIDSGGSVLNLGIENCNITGTIAFTSSLESEYIGGLVGINSGFISNCSSSCSVDSVRSHYIGGLAGKNFGTIEQCNSSVSLSGSSIEYVGGLLGGNQGTVNGCWMTGSVNGRKYIGGLVGQHDQGDIINCYAEGTISSSFSSPALGGLVGVNSGNIDSCNSTSTIVVSPDASIVGGLAGANSGNIDNSYSTSSVEGFSYIGGLAGNNTGIITSSHSTGSIGGSADSEYIGGLVGKNTGNISQSYSTSNVCGYEDVGGLTGWNESSGIIQECFSRGLVTGLSDSLNVGGLTGRNWHGGTINNCYSESTVNGNRNVGGLVGCDDGIVNNCYSIGIVIGDIYVGGLMGLAGGAVNCFWDTQSSGITGSGGGAPKTTQQMQQAANYIGWNTPKKTVWTLDENNDYPHLAWENQPGTALPSQTFSDFVPGQGTLTAPYCISALEQLNLIGCFYTEWDGVFCLENDIDCTALGERKFNKIGVNSYAPFSGIFDGNGYVICNFSYSGTNSERFVGFFGYIDADGQVKNLGLEDCTVSGFSSSNQGLGGLVARSDGSIYNCYFKGVVRGNLDVGGLAGTNWGNIKSCYVIGDIYGTDNSSSRIGGLAGYNPGSISNSFSEGTVNGGPESHLVGGLVGHLYGDIINCYSTSTTSGYEDIGGLVGNCYVGNIKNSYATGNVTGLSESQHVGGLAGKSGSLTSNIVNCYSTSNVSGSSYVGGLIGINYSGCTVNYCYSTGPVNGSSSVGGLIGRNTGNVNNSFWDTQISGQLTSEGGIGKTTSQLKTLATFTNAGWDFSPSCIDGDYQDWSLTAEGIEYPKLKWQLPLTYTAGTGLPSDPYIIANKDDFWLFIDSWWDWDHHFILKCDIDLNGPIFNRALIPVSPDGSVFSGVFEGNGHAITNLVIQGSENMLGLFGQVGASGQIRNLHLHNVSIGTTSNSDLMGSLVGQNYGRIENCSSIGIIAGDSESGSVGGLVGENYGEILDCNADCQVSGYNGIGGLVGNNEGNISFCFATGSTVNASNFSQGLGGLVGYNREGGYINHCYAMGSVDGSRNCSDFGGLVGFNSRSTISNCYSSGLINEGIPGMDFGGLVGGVYYDSATITINSFWDIQSSGQTTSKGGEGKTTAEMQTSSTFISAGWDFESIWWINEGNDYPRLWWEFTNTQPVANAGDDITSFAFIDEYALVKLVGTASYDADGDELEYYWYYGNDLVATGAEPNVLLPVGENVIDLIVNDSIVDSEPNDVLITVIRTLKAPMNLTPRTLNCRSQGNWIKAHFTLPEEYSILDIDSDRPAVVDSYGIESALLEVFINKEKCVEITASFDREAICSLAGNWPEVFRVYGFFTDGSVFYGESEIRINPASLKEVSELAMYWLGECDYPDWCEGMDLNRDTMVNLQDYPLLLNSEVEFITE